MPRRAWLIVSSSYCQSCYVKNGNEPQTSSSSSLPSSSPSSPLLFRHPSFLSTISSTLFFLPFFLHFILFRIPFFASSFTLLSILVDFFFAISRFCLPYWTISSYSLLVLHSRRPHYRPPFHSRRRRDRVNVSERTVIAPFKRAL